MALFRILQARLRRWLSKSEIFSCLAKLYIWLGRSSKGVVRSTGTGANKSRKENVE